MKHIVICDYGVFLGLDNQCLAVKQNGEKRHYPLNRLCTISVAKRGVSLSSDLIEALSARGIKLFFLDFRGVPHSALLGESQHGVVAVRMAQMDYCRGNTLPLAKQFIVGKIRNQRAVLNYLNKYHKNNDINIAANTLKESAEKANTCQGLEVLLGFEGSSAATYFQALRSARLFSSTFIKREGRGSSEVNNSLLNYGYAILNGYILNAVINAGLEPYLGVLHGTRPGKMALVLDIMEEYRSWVVDRIVIKLRSQSEGQDLTNVELRKKLIGEIQGCCSRKYPYRGKSIKLEHIIQRQVYRLCGYFYGEKQYKPYLFRW